MTGITDMLVSYRTDGWFEAEDMEGTKGLVPSTYLKVLSKQTLCCIIYIIVNSLVNNGINLILVM